MAGASRRIASRWVGLLLGGATIVAVGVVLARRFDLGHWEAETVAAQIRASGTVGPFALIALLVFQAVVAPLPAPPLLMAAGYVYGPWAGFGIGWLGLLLGASACFALARTFGRPFAARFVSADRLAAVHGYVTTRSGGTLLTLISLRVFMPPVFDAVSYGCGLVGVPFPWFVLATALGEIPKVGSFTYVGAVAGGTPTWLTAWIFLGPAAGLLLLRLLRPRRPDSSMPRW
jgi:uncharacterized membrane protein YdjX (TVP38/TMEM64 family)